MTPAPWVGALGFATATGSALLIATRWASVPDRVDRADGDPSPPSALVLDGLRRLVASRVVARAVGRWRDHRVRRARVAQLPEFVDGVVRSARAGTSLPVALHDGADVVGPPILDDVARLERDLALGIPWADALRRWTRAAASDDVDLFATACILGAEMGRGTADALDGVARTLSDRRTVVAEARSASAQARASALLLGGLPVAFLAVLVVVDPASVAVLLTTPMGWACLLAAVALDGVGVLWMRRLIGSVR